jgi:hypothetical protein
MKNKREPKMTKELDIIIEEDLPLFLSRDQSFHGVKLHNSKLDININLFNFKPDSIDSPDIIYHHSNNIFIYMSKNETKLTNLLNSLHPKAEVRIDLGEIIHQSTQSFSSSSKSQGLLIIDSHFITPNPSPNLFNLNNTLNLNNLNNPLNIEIVKTP